MRRVIFAALCVGAGTFGASAQDVVSLYGTGGGPGAEAFITTLGNGAGGANTSAVEQPTYTVFGYTCNEGVIPPQGPIRIAEPFEVPPGSVWMLHSAELFGYQTNSPPNPTISQVYVAILQDVAGVPGTMIAGNFVTNRLMSAQFSSVYRVSTNPLDATRPVMRLVADLGWAPLLPAGKYWLAYSMRGALTAGPFAVPVVPTEPTHRGYQFFNGAWTPLDGNAATPGVQAQSTVVTVRGDIIFNQPPLPTPICDGDANGDDRVTFVDLNLVLSFFGQTVSPGTNGDVTRDGVVNFQDLNTVLSFFSQECQPHCDNCHAVNGTVHECFHWADDKNGAPCRSKYCIRNIMATSSCDHHPARKGKARCDTDADTGPKIKQEIVRSNPAPTCPAAVAWMDWEPSRTFYGCANDCFRKFPDTGVWRIACVIENCAGTVLQTDDRGEKKKCGC